MFDQRSALSELLDQSSHNASDLHRTLGHMNGANRWLGGFRAVTAHLGSFFQSDHTTVLDVGTGSADLPRWLVRWAGKTGYTLRVTALDANAQIAHAARDRGAADDGVCVVVGNGLQLPLADDSVDVALSTLTLHHLEDRDAILLVNEMRRVAKRAVIINDLERHAVNYWGARAIAATVWRRSPYAQDGPTSVLRSFRPGELQAIGEAAGLHDVRVHRHFPFRLAMVGQP